MSDGGPYKLVWIGLIRWRFSLRWRPTWGAWVQRTDTFLLGVGTEEGW